MNRRFKTEDSEVHGHTSERYCSTNWAYNSDFSLLSSDPIIAIKTYHIRVNIDQRKSSGLFKLHILLCAAEQGEQRPPHPHREASSAPDNLNWDTKEVECLP